MPSLLVHIPAAPEPEALDLLRRQLDSEVILTLGPERPEPARYEILVSGRPSMADLVASPA